MKNLMYLIFEKNGWAKIFISLLACIVLGLLYPMTGESEIFLWLALPFGLWLVCFAIISFAYAWIIQPINWLIGKFKGK